MKSDPKVLAQLMLQGAMPLMAQMITESEPYRMTVDIAAQGKDQIRAHFAEVRKRLDEIEAAVCNNYDQALGRLGEILSDAGLEAIVDQAKARMASEPPLPSEEA
jgi:prephenate dehydrogenase